MTSKSRSMFDTLPPAPALAQFNVVAVAIFVVVAGAGLVLTLQTNNPYWVVGGVLLALGLAQAPRVAQQWERAVVLRLGRFVGLQGPGPLLDRALRGQDRPRDRPAGHHHELCRRADAHHGHGAGQRGRGAVLDGLRR
jgi:hypothetical protein